MTSPTKRPAPSTAVTEPLAVNAGPLLGAPLTERSWKTSLPDRSHVATKALEIISEQSGISMSNLRDDTRFNDIGIDSLLSLMITSQFADELGISADSTLFLENGTVADMKKAMGTSASSTDPPKPQAAELKERRPAKTTAVMPVPQQEVLSSAQKALPPVSTDASFVGDVTADDKFSDVLKIISEEAGVAVEQLADDASLAELGVDSLLSLMIGSRLRDELEIDIDISSVLSSLDSIRALRGALFPVDDMPLKILDGLSSSNSARSEDTPPSAEAVHLLTPPSDTDFPIAAAAGDVPPATSFVLQGNLRTAADILFFFPDGSGLASSYASLPRIRDNLVVYGLNSPYLKRKKTDMDCSWDDLVGSYIAEVRRRQRRGPYSFAGWSAGGIIGYRAAQMLMSAGEVVKDLIIIDSPPPENLKILPEHFFTYCSSSGLFGGPGAAAPEWLISHFRSINRVLSTYFAVPLAVSTLRKVNILWACESSVDDSFHPQPDDPADMKFLTEKRTDFTAGAWARLLPNVPVYVDRAEGQHHWSLLAGRPPSYPLKALADYKPV